MGGAKFSCSQRNYGESLPAQIELRNPCGGSHWCCSDIMLKMVGWLWLLRVEIGDKITSAASTIHPPMAARAISARKIKTTICSGFSLGLN